MKVTIQKDGKTAKCDKGEIYHIHNLIIRKDKGTDETYPPSSSFFKAACPSGTKHHAEILTGKLINVY